MNNLTIDIIPIKHTDQRYVTAGDWCYAGIDPNHLIILVSQHPDWRYPFLVAFHELIEATLCKEAGIAQEIVDEFDMNYNDNDPGGDVNCPYHKQHMIACAMEKELALTIGVNWKDYDDWCMTGGVL